MRVLRSLRMITEDPKISYDELIAKKHSTRMELADRVLPDLLKTANSSTEAARVLERWDRLTDADSRGAVLFQMFANKYLCWPGRDGKQAACKVRLPFIPWTPLMALRIPRAALSALAAAAADCQRLYGSLDVRWVRSSGSRAVTPTFPAMAERVPAGCFVRFPIHVRSATRTTRQGARRLSARSNLPNYSRPIAPSDTETPASRAHRTSRINCR